MSFNLSELDSEQWLSSRLLNFPFDQLDTSMVHRLVKLLSDAVGAFNSFCLNRDEQSIKIFDHCCEQFSKLSKETALENSISKLCELDCYVVALSSYFDMCLQNGSKHKQQTTLNNFSKQIDCLKGIKRCCKNYQTYDDYFPVIQASVPGVDRQFAQGLPLDSIHRSLNSCIASLRNMNFGNIISRDYVDLLNVRSLALKRAKAIHSQHQIVYMDRYARENPLDSQSTIYLDNRESLVKSIDSVLAKTALELSENKSKSHENSQQAQDPASNKKTKSSPDLER